MLRGLDNFEYVIYARLGRLGVPARLNVLDRETARANRPADKSLWYLCGLGRDVLTGAQGRFRRSDSGGSICQRGARAHRTERPGKKKENPLVGPRGGGGRSDRADQRSD